MPFSHRHQQALIGAVLGLVIGLGSFLAALFVADWSWGGNAARGVVLMMVGGVIGWYLAEVSRWVRSRGLISHIELVPIPLAGVGQINLKLAGGGHRQTAWTLFVEAGTRIVTQELRPGDGLLREALTSYYGFFELVRKQLLALRPSPIPADESLLTVESYAFSMLNEALRPCLARWHPRLSRWEKSGNNEEDWPLADLCRQDIEAARQRALIYVWGLGQVAEIGNLHHLLPPRPDSPQPWVDYELLRKREQS